MNQSTTLPSTVPTATNMQSANPLAIPTMRAKNYPGSTITFEQTLGDGSNYHRYRVSYRSEGLKIYALLTVPLGNKPSGGWPVVLFNHGYIPPASYSTTTSYAVMIDPLAAAGYIVFIPDYRGNGESEGTPVQPYVSPDYVTDSMNALASIKQYKDANPNAVAIVGHSMGGNITLHELVISHDIKAAAILSGVVGNEAALLQWWNMRLANHCIVGNDLNTYYVIQNILQKNGTPQSNPGYWNAIDPTKFLSSVSVPVQIQVGAADEVVPPSFASSLRDELQAAGKTVDYHSYPGADHSLAPDTAQAMQTTIAFLNKYLK